jgi:hypothetical protein
MSCLLFVPIFFQRTINRGNKAIKPDQTKTELKILFQKNRWRLAGKGK